MRLLLDSSVWLAWMRADDEPNHEAATAIVARSYTREVELRLLDLTLYELGNVIVRAWQRPSEVADGFVSHVTTVVEAPPLVPTAAERRVAHQLAERHRLSVYDATYAAVAKERRLTLISGDNALLTAGLAAAPGDI
ncbi:MAG TPA: type II toxin-antitoxin system VapC family toxin [Conexibacter sp.]|nr:type II toxin-antitoxin system VapC family toxin [Conexibacter sp.]